MHDCPVAPFTDKYTQHALEEGSQGVETIYSVHLCPLATLSPGFCFPGNESAMVPNGLECYSCEGDECSTDNATIVKCYNSFKGCFHGNVTMRAGKMAAIQLHKLEFKFSYELGKAWQEKEGQNCSWCMIM